MYDQATLRVNDQLKLMEIEKQRIRRSMERECKDFSITNLHFEARREFDLNDRQSKKKDLPPRVGDSDPRCGPASMQQFAGEDLMKRERVRQQQVAQASWVEQQTFEKAMLSIAGKDEDAAFAKQVKEISTLRDEMEASEGGLRKEMLRAHQLHNLQRADVEAEVRKTIKLSGSLEDKAELEHHAQDPFLNETAPSHMENGRVIKGAYKGSTRSERTEVASIQRAQAVDAHAHKQMDRHEDVSFGQNFEQTRRQLVGLEREKQRNRRAIMEQVAQENRLLASQQTAEKQQLKNVYTNSPSAEFFSQFGKSTR